MFVHPPESLLCSICWKVLNDPRHCKNGHLFCAECIKGTLNETNQYQCSTCQTFISSKSLRKLPSIVALIQSLEVRCSRCKWIGNFALLSTHICAMKSVLCTNRGCDTIVLQTLLSDHLASQCPKRLIRCDHCATAFTSDVLGKHMSDSCTRRKVKCSCGETVPANELEVHMIVNDCVSPSPPLWLVSRSGAAPSVALVETQTEIIIESPILHQSIPATGSSHGEPSGRVCAEVNQPCGADSISRTPGTGFEIATVDITPARRREQLGDSEEVVLCVYHPDREEASGCVFNNLFIYNLILIFIYR